MDYLPCTTVAGRHAADRARDRDRAEAQSLIAELQDRVRGELDRELRSYGLTTHPHLHPALGYERSLWVNCRLASAATDHALVYAILDELGWSPDRARLSRIRQTHDVLRLRHAATDATLVLIVKVPFGEVAPLEAA